MHRRRHLEHCHCQNQGHDQSPVDGDRHDRAVVGWKGLEAVYRAVRMLLRDFQDGPTPVTAARRLGARSRCLQARRGPVHAVADGARPSRDLRFANRRLAKCDVPFALRMATRILSRRAAIGVLAIERSETGASVRT